MHLKMKIWRFHSCLESTGPVLYPGLSDHLHAFILQTLSSYYTYTHLFLCFASLPQFRMVTKNEEIEMGKK